MVEIQFGVVSTRKLRKSPASSADMRKVETVKKRLIRRSEVEKITGLTTSRLYEMMKAKEFPKAVPIGPFAVAWVESEVDQWVNARIEARETQGVKPHRRNFEKKKAADSAAA